MRPVSAKQIANWIGLDGTYPDDRFVAGVQIDTRKLLESDSVSNQLFVAIQGDNRDGHQYISEAYDKGIRHFLVHKPMHTGADAIFYQVPDTLQALQLLAKSYRNQFDLKVIAITGSNGKTTVKEWLSYMLAPEHIVVKSPKSYNSQVGVPLSLFEIEATHTIGIFEAGISQIGEMEVLENILQPDLTIILNVWDAHSSGFETQSSKIDEKIRLAANSNAICYRSDYSEIGQALSQYSGTKLSWGAQGHPTVFTVLGIDKLSTTVKVTILLGPEIYYLHLHVLDDGSIENVLFCLLVLLHLEVDIKEAIKRCETVFPIPMRLQMVTGRTGSKLIMDAYNHDPTSFQIAIDYMQRQALGQASRIIMTAFEDSNLDTDQMHEFVQKKVASIENLSLWWVGPTPPTYCDKAFDTTQDVVDFINHEIDDPATILLKGSRSSKFEHILQVLKRQGHSASLTIDLDAIDHNLQVYSRYIQGHASIIAVIKASAYGSGSVELASILQYRGVRYLAVAYPDEGVILRESGINMPIMVLNADESHFNTLLQYRLEPEIYTLNQLKALGRFMNKLNIDLPIHLKLDTGMHRLGFDNNSYIEAISFISANHIRVSTIFSHLASSDSAPADHYNYKQKQTFDEMVDVCIQHLGYKPQLHLVNTAGIIRLPEMHYDLVRIGLGMYGIDTTGQVSDVLEKAHTFNARILQIRSLIADTPIGYNQSGILYKDSVIAVVNVGYADGLPRSAGNGNYSLWLDGSLAPIIGNVCMDLTIIDVTNIPNAKEGSIVEIFGKNMSIESLAKATQTIPYEIISKISDRVKKEWILG